MESFKERRTRLDRQITALGGAFGRFLRATLHERGWIDEDLALRAGLGVSTVNKLVRGTRDNPTLETVVRVAIALETRPDDLLSQVLTEANGAWTTIQDERTPDRDNVKWSLATILTGTFDQALSHSVAR